MEISKTNQSLVKRIQKIFSKHVSNKKALTSMDKHLVKIQGTNKKLQELYNLVKKVSNEHNTLSKLVTHERHTKQRHHIKQTNHLELQKFNSFKSPEQEAAIYESIRLLPKLAKAGKGKAAQIKDIGAEYKKKNIVAIFVDQKITRDKLQKLGDKISMSFKARGVKGSIGIAIKYEEAWRASQFVNFGEKVRLHTNLDSDEAFDEDDIQAYELYYIEAFTRWYFYVQ
jgi:hypothetical protein